MNIIIISFLLFSVFEGAISWQLSVVEKLRDYQLSAFERRLKNKSGILGLYISVMSLIVKFGGIAFLIYFGYKTVWHNPIILYFVSLALCSITTLILRVKTTAGIALTTIGGTVIVPVLFVSMWAALFNY